MPVRIAGIILPESKRIQIALARIYGVGNALSRQILAKTGVDPMTRTRDLTEKEAGTIRDFIAEHVRVEGDLRREVADNIRRLKDSNSFRGSRHARRLPVRGQRTRTNSRTVRGNVRKTAGSGRRTAAEKT